MTAAFKGLVLLISYASLIFSFRFFGDLLLSRRTAPDDCSDTTDITDPQP